MAPFRRRLHTLLRCLRVIATMDHRSEVGALKYGPLVQQERRDKGAFHHSGLGR